MTEELKALEIIKGALVEIEYDEEEDIILSAWQEHEEETNIIERALKSLDNLSSNIKVFSYATYAEEMNRDCMIYGVEFKNGRKEYISRELFVLLKELLHE